MIWRVSDFQKGTRKEDVRLLGHFIKTSSDDNSSFSASSAELMKILCDEYNETSLSTALLDPLNQTEKVMGV